MTTTMLVDGYTFNFSEYILDIREDELVVGVRFFFT
jgi:hypothetical protein